jgi:hypothetical protein
MAQHDPAKYRYTGYFCLRPSPASKACAVSRRGVLWLGEIYTDCGHESLESGDGVAVGAEGGGATSSGPSSVSNYHRAFQDLPQVRERCFYSYERNCPALCTSEII